MVSPKMILTVFLATTALASPAKLPMSEGYGDLTSSLEERAPTGDYYVYCKVDQPPKNGKAVPAKEYKFSWQSAKKLVKTIPAGDVNKSYTTASGYPHAFANIDNLQWSQPECRYNSKKSGTVVGLIEFPIYGNPDELKVFPYKSKKTGGVPPCRAVYARTGGAFCGVMCHKSEDSQNVKGFNMCVKR